MKKCVIFAIIIFLLVVPPFFHGGHNLFIYSFFLIAGGLLLFLFFLLEPKEKTAFLPSTKTNLKNLPLFFWLLFLFLLLITICFSISPYYSLKSYFEWIIYFVLFFISAFLVIPTEKIKSLIYAVLIVGFFLSIAGIFFYLNALYPRMMSTFYCPNAFAGYLLFTLPPALILFFQKNREDKGYLILMILSIILLSVFLLTGSRSGYLSFLLPGLGCLWLLKSFPKKELIAKLTILISGVAFLTIILFFARTGVNLFLKPMDFLGIARYGPVGQLVEATIFSRAGRLPIWEGAFGAFKNNVLTGSGLDTFRIIHPIYQKNPLSFSISAHNQYLELLSETGLIGTIPFLFLIFSLLIIGVKVLKASPLGEEKVCQSIFFLGILGVMIHSAFNPTWYFLANPITFWIFAGLMYNIYLKYEK